MASENLMDEQRQLIGLSEDIKFRLKHFSQSEHMIQRLQNPTFSPSSDQFVDIINSIDECMEYLKEHVSPKIVFSSDILILTFFSQISKRPIRIT